MKRFTVRKVKCHSYSRQGWILKFCHGANCSKCPVHDAINCKFAWAQMSYEEAKGEE